MLLGNYSYINAICGHNHSGITNPVQFFQPHVMRGWFYKQDSTNTSQIARDSFPTGTNAPYAYLMGDKGALLSSTTTLSGNTSIAAALSKGGNIFSNITGEGSLAASLKLVTALNSTISGSGTLVGSLVGSVALAATINGTTSVAASLGLISNMISALSGNGTIDANLKGKANLEADIYVNQSQATIDELVAGVWNAIATDYNNGSSMGEIMNNMGAVADPWSTTLPGTYTGDQAGAIVDRLETLIKQIKALTSAGL